MADKPKETHTEHKTTEVSEVQSFSGGEVHSIEPIEEGHTDLHVYSGGEIVEHSTTSVSPVLWGFWAVTIVVIIGVVLGSGAAFNKLTGMAYPTPAGDLAAYREQYQSQMAVEFPVAGQHAMIAMESLPRPAGQTIGQGVKAGEDVYTTYCIGCHGPNQDGAGPNSTTLDPKPRNLHDAPFMQAMSLERINTSVHKGVPGTAMPRWESQLSEDQIKDVILYVFSLTAPTDAKGDFLTESDIQKVISTPVPPPSPATPSADVHTSGVNNTAPASPAAAPPSAPSGAATPAPATTSPTAMRTPGGPDRRDTNRALQRQAGRGAAS